MPKLVAEDIPLLQSLLSDVFPGVRYVGAEMKGLKAEIKKVCTEMNLVYGEGEEQGSAWVEKVTKGVYAIANCNHVYSRWHAKSRQICNDGKMNPSPKIYQLKRNLIHMRASMQVKLSIMRKL